jgi:hypothetical protein
LKDMVDLGVRVETTDSFKMLWKKKWCICEEVKKKGVEPPDQTKKNYGKKNHNDW